MNFEVAIRRTDLKETMRSVSLCGLPTVRVGINFSSEKRTTSDWKIETA